MKLVHLFDVSVEHDAKAHAERVFPQESCGVVIDGKYQPLENLAPDKENYFSIDPAVFVGMEVEAIIHSHPNGVPVPSEADMTSQIATAVPWGLFASKKDDVTETINHTAVLWFGDQVPRYPLLGRPFVHGLLDCYGLIRDVYLEELGVHLIDFPRDWEWWLQGKNLYDDCFKKAGFRKISEREVKKYDLIISSLAMRDGTPNHGSLYYGDDLVIHHIAASSPVDFSRLSAIVPAAPYLKRAVFFLRHESCD